MEAKLKHLEFIQSAISRMATCSFLFKGWAITLAVGLSAFGAIRNKSALLLMAVLSTLLFWGLDGYYLWLERGFVKLHAEVAAKSPQDIDFSMRIDKTRAAGMWFRTCWRPHLFLLYGAIIAVDIVGIFAVKAK
jgi:hypothetical protein